ncbi:alternate-type signal peptide domain-containing protein [Aeromicrobium duanguangcaii]|uniref:alternate-type signal peptide domain-containing protein n=1 Tax=Aeromicrobium duanguangcaii TaxID=2968086 RepID=UPI002017A8A6|nr:alternate-type signal peptide domain-containing protein [Aeromicrobium duanguangcaii]MCL3836921.1 alternate-type signal peptide domain-containing protein [Aeromicrobium duanguangcaii]
MNKSTKGAVAAGAAAVLLLGGAGSLAYWNAEGIIAGGTISSGELKLTAKDAGTWTLNGTKVTTGTPTIVPGDELVFSGSYTIVATGNNIKANLGVTGGTGTAWAGSTVTPSFTLDGAAVATGTAPITSAQNGKDVAAQIRIDFPFGTTVDNTSQKKSVNLAAVGVTLTQTDASPAQN